ncbi:MAG: hypothetical protein NC037_01310 [Bacteroides sp.]|nr:DNA-3-methyladenine glycosylase 2 family protein [Bacillota bacterium]MCM1394328.1 DNA-3-methyladenine glycosylase 2 family protein [[Eubacterium] siraeum]MCM1455153.1 hypothetical protein [Bacteroides sp.]
MSFEIEKTPYFDVGQTLNCGQVFRFKEDKGGYIVNALDHIARIDDKGEFYAFDCDDAEFFKKYFDFDTDYKFIQSKVEDKGLISSAIEFGRGIHILRQNPTETVFSFLISQNNHIPRIKGIIERMCAGLGKDMGGYYAFPTVEALAEAGEEYFSSIGAGYRAAYLARTAQALSEMDASGFSLLDTAELRSSLMSLHGVGRKVADCILLFGFNRFDVFPVDTWIKKVFEETYKGVPAEKLSVLLVEKYGEYAGFVQQWLFYYKRELARIQANDKKL